MIQHLDCGIAGKEFSHNAYAFIKEAASGLGIRGAAFTKVDGSLRIVAEGEEADLTQFAEQLRNGGIYHEVENFYAHISDPVENFGDFYVLDN